MYAEPVGITLQAGPKAFSMKGNETLANFQLSLSPPATTNIFLGPASAHNNTRQQSHATLNSAGSPY